MNQPYWQDIDFFIKDAYRLNIYTITIINKIKYNYEFWVLYKILS